MASPLLVFLQERAERAWEHRSGSWLLASLAGRQDDEDGGRILEITAPPTFAHARRAPDDCHVTGVEGVVSPLGGWIKQTKMPLLGKKPDPKEQVSFLTHGNSL